MSRTGETDVDLDRLPKDWLPFRGWLTLSVDAAEGVELFRLIVVSLLCIPKDKLR